MKTGCAPRIAKLAHRRHTTFVRHRPDVLSAPRLGRMTCNGRLNAQIAAELG